MLPHCLIDMCLVGKASALSVSGFKWGNIAPCVNWMAPFALITKRYDIPSVLPSVETVQDDARHLVQTNCINIDMMVSSCMPKTCWKHNKF
jgi:hypothetical protein